MQNCYRYYYYSDGGAAGIMIIIIYAAVAYNISFHLSAHYKAFMHMQFRYSSVYEQIRTRGASHYPLHTLAPPVIHVWGAFWASERDGDNYILLKLFSTPHPLTDHITTARAVQADRCGFRFQCMMVSIVICITRLYYVIIIIPSHLPASEATRNFSKRGGGGGPTKQTILICINNTYMFLLTILLL